MGDRFQRNPHPPFLAGIAVSAAISENEHTARQPAPCGIATQSSAAQEDPFNYAHWELLAR
jgi:hypothetical protein